MNAWIPRPFSRSSFGGRGPRRRMRVAIAVAGGTLGGLAAFAAVYWATGERLPGTLDAVIAIALVLIGVFSLNSLLATEGRPPRDEPVD
jgi:hypothetical protein